MSDYLTVFDRVHFDASGNTIKWERSIDGGHEWVVVDWPEDRLPFILIKPIDRDLVWIVKTSIDA